MPSFQDSAVIFFIALLLFGPKKLPELARYVGKLMGEFRRASSEFRIQMEDEFRLAEQAEQQKKIAAIEAAAPVAPLLHQDLPEPEHPHMDAPLAAEENVPTDMPERHIDARPEPIAIASSGELNMMPPATGLPVSRSASSSSLGAVFESIPHVPDPAPAAAEPEAHSNV
jgi:sec-independent protein translocase protein TatB